MATLESAKSKYVSDAVHTMSPGRMIVALYDRVILDLQRAEGGIADNDVYASHSALRHAQEIIGELYVALDVSQWSGGATLASLYRYIMDELVTANVDKDATRVRACRELLVPLRDAWREASGIVSSERPA
jgi:flagellar secretion chaperone FliS